MARTSRLQPLPEDSWVMEGDSDASLSDSSGDEEVKTVEKTPKIVARQAQLPRQGERHTYASNGRSTQDASAIPGPQLVMPSLHMDQYSPANSPRPRKRATPSSGRLTHSTGNALKTTYRPTRRTEDENESITDYVNLLWSELFLPVARFSHSVVSHVLKILKPALAFFAAIWIIFFVGHHLLTSTIARSLAPLCSVPGMGRLDLPFCSIQKQSGPVEFNELMTVQSAFEDVLSSSSGGMTLPADMKRSESSIKDLKHVVQYSNLPSKQEIVFEFNGFIETAREASSDLIRFNSRIGRAVDQVISTNRWTLQVIDGVAERELSKGALSRLVYGTVLYPFYSETITEQLLLEQYLRHTRNIEEHIAELIGEAQTLLAILQNLDDRLDVIHDITTRDGISVKGSRDENLAHLWTKLGGNRSSRKKHDEQLYLLQKVGNYRKLAFDHVSQTMLKLQLIAAGLEDLRERVAAPDVLGAREGIPLKLHIDNIQMAVDRLDDQRSESRRLEGEHHRRVLGKGGEQLLLP